MLDPSFSRSPEAPVLFARSEPARSTSERRDTFTPLTPDASSVSLNVTTIVNTAWDLKKFVNVNKTKERNLLDSLFMFVAATVRDLFPSEKKIFS